MIVFIVGGATYTEAEAVANINKTTQGIRIILGGTTIHTSRRYVCVWEGAWFHWNGMWFHWNGMCNMGNVFMCMSYWCSFLGEVKSSTHQFSRGGRTMA